jgi:hypothetical protein
MEPKMLASEASDYLQVTLPAIHKHLKSKNLAYTKSQNKVYFDHVTSKQIFKLAFKPSCWSWQNRCTCCPSSFFEDPIGPR